MRRENMMNWTVTSLYLSEQNKKPKAMKLSRHTNCCTAKHVHRSLVCTLSFGTAELVDATTVSNDQPVGNTSTPSEPLTFEVNCCRMHVPDRVKSSFVIFQRHSVQMSKINPVWHRMLYSCTNRATVGVKGLMLTLRHVLHSTMCETVT